MRRLQSILVISVFGYSWAPAVSAQHGGGDASEVFASWVRAAAATPAFEVVWEVPTRLMARDGKVQEEFLLRERFVFRWPCCFAASGRVVQPAGIAPDTRNRMRFDYDEVLDAEGRHRKALVRTGHFEEYSRRDSMVPFLPARMIDAPDLLGLWLAESDAIPSAGWSADGRIVAEIDGLGLRAFLGRPADEQDGPWGVVRLEFLDDDGAVRSAWAYSELAHAAGMGTAVGTRRRYEPVKSGPGGSDHPASLLEIKAIAPPDDSVFLLQAEGITSTDPVSGEIKTPDGTVVGVDEAARRRRVPWAVVAGCGVALVVTAGLAWVVVRSKR